MKRSRISLLLLMTPLLGAGFCGEDLLDAVYERPRAVRCEADPSGAIPEACRSVELTVKPTFPDQASLDDTKRLLLVIRKPSAAQDGCEALWSTDPSLRPEGATLIDMGSANNLLVVPESDDTTEFTVLAYAYAESFDLLCQTDAWCEDSTSGPSCARVYSGVDVCAAEATTPAAEPLAGGCTTAKLVPGQKGEIVVTLAAPPAS